MNYSQENPCKISSKCYTHIEDALEGFYNSEHNPFRHLFENAERVGYEYMIEKFDLVIKDYNEGINDDLISVRLQSKENPNYVPFRDVFHKEFGGIG